MRTLSIIIISLITFGVNGQLSFDLETGISFNTKNSIRFPNSSTSFSDQVDIPNEFGVPNTFFYRARASYTVDDRHTISVLFAPLEFISSGNFDRPIDFGEYTYESDDYVDVIYKFNSYRLTYRYQLFRREKLRFGIGITGKIRDARIAFESGQKNDETTDLGFVPLINFRLAL